MCIRDRYITLSYLNWHRNGEPSKFEVWKKCLTYIDLYSKMHLFHAVFLDFKLQRLAIFMPVEVGERCVPQKKALLPIVWKKFWNWTKFCHERLQTSFSRGSAFSLKGAWPCSGSCHAQFHTLFQKLYFRAFKWGIICSQIFLKKILKSRRGKVHYMTER